VGGTADNALTKHVTGTQTFLVRVAIAFKDSPESAPESPMLPLRLGRRLAGGIGFTQGVLHGDGEIGGVDVPSELPGWLYLGFAYEQEGVNRLFRRR